MKHFGAVLTGDNNIVDGSDSSILRVGSSSVGTHDDAIIINNNNTTTGTTDAASDGSVHGLVIVPSAANRGATHLIGADGREVAISSLTVDLDFSAVGTIPVSHDSSQVADNFTGTADEFIDSALSQTGAGATSVVTAAGNVVVTGDLTVNGTTTQVNTTNVNLTDSFLLLNSDDTSDGTNADFVAGSASGGLLIRDQRASGVDGFGGFRWNGASSSFEFSSDTTTGTDGTWTAFGTATGLVAVEGEAGISANTNAGTVTVSASLTTLGVANGTTTAGGGLILTNGTGAASTDAAATIGISAGGITAGQLATGIASTRAGLVNGTTGQILASQGNGGFAWADGATGTVTKYAGTHTVGAGTISIPFSMAEVANTSHALAGSDFTVSIYEYLEAGGAQHTGAGAVTNLRYNQVFPESVTIGTQDSAAGGTGATLTGTVTITLPTTQNANQFRVVIKS